MSKRLGTLLSKSSVISFFNANVTVRSGTSNRREISRGAIGPSAAIWSRTTRALFGRSLLQVIYFTDIKYWPYLIFILPIIAYIKIIGKYKDLPLRKCKTALEDFIDEGAH